MKHKLAQISIEYTVCLAVLLIIFFAMYQLSFDMQSRMVNLTSVFEGEKISAKISDATDWAMIIGRGSDLSLKIGSTPQQRIVASGSQIISFGVSNQTFAVSPTIGRCINRFESTNDIWNIRVMFNGTNVSLSQ